MATDPAVIHRQRPEVRQSQASDQARTIAHVALRIASQALAKAAYERLPGYAVPLFVRVVGELAHTSTFKSQKVDLRKEGYGRDVKDAIYVLGGRDEGYVPFYDTYPDEVKNGKRPK